MAALRDPVVVLPGGGRMIVQPTATLTAIDVDLAGRDSGGGKTASHIALGAAVLPERARQIRLRNLGGAILVDLAGLSEKRRVALAPALQAALAADPVGCRLVGFTGLGLAEIVRARTHRPLHEVLVGPHAAAIEAARAAVALLAPAWRCGCARRRNWCAR